MNSYRRLSNTHLLLVFGFLLFFPLIADADPLDNWHWRSGAFNSGGLHPGPNVTYGKNIFVAAGSGILTSPDGVNWAFRTAPGILYSLNGVAYVNDIFVAVGIMGVILTSSDGVTWTSRNSKTSNFLYGVAYGNGTFVAVGDQGTIVNSSDGVTWTATTLEKDYTLIGIVYANNTFVAPAWEHHNTVVAPWEYHNTVLTSFDGKTWTAQDLPPSYHPGSLEGIAYGNGMFVVVGDRIHTSSDGVKWTERISETNNTLYGVGYGNNTFVAVGYSGTIVTSSDGATWVPRTSGTTNWLWEVVYGNGTFVAVGEAIILQSDPLGRPPEADISVNRASINFGNVNIGSSPAQSVTVSNVGNANLTIGTITLPSPPFSKSADNCSGLTLSPGASCNVTYTFSPTSIGSFFSNSNIPSNDPDENPVTISLAGTGVSLNLPDITVTPLSLNFGNVNVGSSSTPQIATIRNDGSANLSLGSIAITGTNASEFNKTADTCSGQILTPGASCSLQVRFSPTSAGSKAATLSIPSNDPDENPVGVSLSGIGTTQQYTITITKSGAGTGTVTSSPKGISCGTDCTEGYKPGTKLTLKAKADTNSTFTGWSGGGCSGTGSCVVTLESDTVVTANFAIKTQQLPPIINSITPTSGTAGTVVTIKGKNFGATQGTSFVSFGSTQAAINSWSNTQIKAVAPSGPSGKVPVTVTTTGGASNSKDFIYRRVIIIDIDGLRRDSFDLTYLNGLLPNFERILGKISENKPFANAMRFINATTVFPSVTLTGQASIFTGVYPGRHGIVGNQWFNRHASPPHFTSYMSPLTIPCVFNTWIPGCEEGLANQDLTTQTIYEVAKQAGKTSYVIFNQYWKGSTNAVQPSVLEQLWYMEEEYFDFDSFDKRMIDHAIEEIEAKGLPDILTIYVSGSDAVSHKLGTSSQINYMQYTIDPQVGRLLNKLELLDSNWRDTTLFVITADHGRTDTISPDEDKEIDNMIKGTLESVGYDSSRAQLALNGGMAHLYLRSRLTDNPWSEVPPKVDILFAAQELFRNGRLSGSVESILVRENGPGSGYKVYGETKAGKPLLKTLSKKITKLVQWLDSSRSGDILILLKQGHYFVGITDLESIWGVGSNHGSLHDPDLAVPLILSGGGIVPKQSSTSVSTVNIAQTIANFLGFKMDGIEPALPVKWK